MTHEEARKIAEEQLRQIVKTAKDIISYIDENKSADVNRLAWLTETLVVLIAAHKTK